MSNPSQSTPSGSKTGPTLPPFQSILTHPSDDWNLKGSEPTGSFSSTSVPGAPLLLYTPLPPSSSSRRGPEELPQEPNPSSRPRTRKAKTKETMLTPDDNRSMIALGITPFMPGQDPISNQNRLVRNETIFARHLSNLQKAYSTSESTHANRMEDVYRILVDHKSSIELLKSASGASTKDKNVRSDPDFAALVEAHGETRKALNDLVKDIASFSESTRQTIDTLTETISRLSLSQNPTLPPAFSHSVPGSPITSPPVLTITSVRSDPPPIENASLKRRRTESGISPTSDLSAAAILAIPTKTLPERKTLKEVIYGPMTDRDSSSEGDLSLNQARAIGNDAVSHVGLFPSMIHSIRPAPGRSGYIIVSFLKADYATRFVDLVSFGLDEQPGRVAFFDDQPQPQPQGASDTNDVNEGAPPIPIPSPDESVAAGSKRSFRPW